MKILRVNLTDKTTSTEELPEAWKLLGGRGLTSRIISQEVSPGADPLGPEAKLVIASGPLAGTLAPSCGRLSVGGKSPLTRGIKEANAGGPAGQKMDKLGVRAIVLEGKAEDGGLYLLKMDKEGAVIEDAASYKGLNTYETAAKARAEYDADAAIICIGPVGERCHKSATVTLTDKNGHCSRHAARGGLGAVMGSKGLKAIVLNDKGTEPISYADEAAFRNTIKTWASDVVTQDPAMLNMSKLGTPGFIITFRSMGSMPANNYSSETVEGFEALDGRSLEKINKERGAKMDACMPGCLVRCSVIYNDAQGNHITSSYEYETLALMGTNLGLVDPDVVAKMDRLADELGIDTIELGSAMGVAASAGKMTFGDADSAFALVDEVAKGTDLGRTLADGTVATAKALGVARIPAVKGQGIPAHDGRVTKSTGVTYHTSPMGADHTAGISYDDPMNKEGQVERSLQGQIFIAALDSMGYCTLAQPGDRKVLAAFLLDLVKARFGQEMSAAEMVQIGRDTLKTELEFNKGTEFHQANEPDPDFYRTEPLAPTGNVFDVDQKEIDGIWEKLETIEVL